MKKNKRKNKNNIKFSRKFNLFKSVFIVKLSKNLFYNLKRYNYGIGCFKLYILLFLSNIFSYLSIYKLSMLNAVGVKFSLFSLFLCLKKELYKKGLLLKKFKKK